MKLQEFFNDYYYPIKEKSLRECTLAGYRSAWKVHIQPHFGEWELEDILPREIEKWLLSIEKPGAAKKAWTTLRPMLRMAVRYDFLEMDPTSKVIIKFNKPKYVPETLTREELTEMLKAFQGSKLEAWLLIAATTGLRKEEGAALLWSDIELKTGAVSITKGAQWVDGKEIINPPKTQLSYRTVYVPENSLERLREIALTDGRVIGSLHAGQLTPHFRRECERRDVKYIPPKNLRHTWATLALEEGVPISVVSRCLGHYDVSTTARYYLAPNNTELIQASQTYNNILSNKPRGDENQKELRLLLEKIKELI